METPTNLDSIGTSPNLYPTQMPKDLYPIAILRCGIDGEFRRLDGIDYFKNKPKIKSRGILRDKKGIVRILETIAKRQPKNLSDNQLREHVRKRLAKMRFKPVEFQQGMPTKFPFVYKEIQKNRQESLYGFDNSDLDNQE